jgi:hypothetical protein
MNITLGSLRTALDQLGAAGYPDDSEIVLTPVYHDPERPQMALAVLEDGETAFIPGTTMHVDE